MGDGEERARQHLLEHLGFLSDFCSRWDEGQWQYAKLIANSLRLLFHDKGRIVSIVTQLGQRSRLKLIDLVPWGNDEHTVFFFDPVMLLGTGARLIPGPMPVPRLVSVNTWWHEIVCALPAGCFTREDIVLTVTEKDGGTHLDARLPPDYRNLATDGAAGFYKSIPTRDAQLIQLRRIAAEILESPGLRQLADGSFADN